MRRLVLPLCVFLSGGCVINIGTRAQNMAVVNLPSGTMADVLVNAGGEVFTGELLAVREGDLVVLNAGRVTIVSVGAIRRATFRDSWVSLDGGGVFSPAEISELRLLSRYPQGISAGVMTALLAAHGQTEPRLIAR